MFWVTRYYCFWKQFKQVKTYEYDFFYHMHSCRCKISRFFIFLSFFFGELTWAMIYNCRVTLVWWFGLCHIKYKVLLPGHFPVSPKTSSVISNGFIEVSSVNLIHLKEITFKQLWSGPHWVSFRSNFCMQGAAYRIERNINITTLNAFPNKPHDGRITEPLSVEKTFQTL